MIGPFSELLRNSFLNMRHLLVSGLAMPMRAVSNRGQMTNAGMFFVLPFCTMSTQERGIK
jgi:hypothetical protein